MKRLTSAIVTIAFILTQCGLGMAAPNKGIGRNLRARAAGDQCPGKGKVVIALAGALGAPDAVVQSDTTPYAAAFNETMPSRNIIVPEIKSSAMAIGRTLSITPNDIAMKLVKDAEGKIVEIHLGYIDSSGNFQRFIDGFRGIFSKDGFHRVSINTYDREGQSRQAILTERICRALEKMTNDLFVSLKSGGDAQEKRKEFDQRRVRAFLIAGILFPLVNLGAYFAAYSGAIDFIINPSFNFMEYLYGILFQNPDAIWNFYPYEAGTYLAGQAVFLNAVLLKIYNKGFLRNPLALHFAQGIEFGGNNFFELIQQDLAQVAEQNAAAVHYSDSDQTIIRINSGTYLDSLKTEEGRLSKRDQIDEVLLRVFGYMEFPKAEFLDKYSNMDEEKKTNAIDDLLAIRNATFMLSYRHRGDLDDFLVMILDGELKTYPTDDVFLRIKSICDALGRSRQKDISQLIDESPFSAELAEFFALYKSNHSRDRFARARARQHKLRQEAKVDLLARKEVEAGLLLDRPPVDENSLNRIDEVTPRIKEAQIGDAEVQQEPSEPPQTARATGTGEAETGAAAAGAWEKIAAPKEIPISEIDGTIVRLSTEATSPMYLHLTRTYVEARNALGGSGDALEISASWDEKGSLPAATEVYTLREGFVCNIGRHPDNDLVINPNAYSVSRHQLQIKLAADKVIITDVGSTFGTFINQPAEIVEAANIAMETALLQTKAPQLSVLLVGADAGAVPVSEVKNFLVEMGFIADYDGKVGIETRTSITPQELDAVRGTYTIIIQRTDTGAYIVYSGDIQRNLPAVGSIEGLEPSLRSTILGMCL